MAPVLTPLGSVNSIDQLYDRLAAACELRMNEIKKIATVSATYNWSGEKQRLRKGSVEDWESFKATVEEAYEQQSNRANKMCKVLMTLHVEE